jgi:PDZ domain-containing protein
MSGFIDKSKQKSLARRAINWGVFLAFTGAGLFVVIAQTPYLVEQPGPVYNLLSDINGAPMIQISKQKTYPVDGVLDMLTVTMRGTSSKGASWLEVGWAKLDPSMSIVNITDIYPKGWDDAKLGEQADLMMLDSQANAKSAALNLLKIPFKSEIKVTMVEKKGPSGLLLKASDTLVRVQGEKATGLEQVRKLVAETKGLKPVVLDIVRQRKNFTVNVMPKLIDKEWRMGIYVQTVPTFPFPIDVKVGNVGGPSAGQMMALAIYDKLTPGPLTAGQEIAGTGTVTPEGQIGPIGGIKQKMHAAKRAGIKWFLAPSANCEQVIRNIPDGIRVVKVSTLQDSLAAVQAIASDKNTDQLPSCTK